MQPVDAQRLASVFLPYAVRKTAEVKANGGRFAYYTTAEVAACILTSQEIWMRNATVMNDFLEISHGLQCLRAAYNGSAGAVLKRALNAAFPGLPEEIEEMFDTWLLTIQVDTYLTCVSEHRVEEDLRGRLSMWRAYGGVTGVAIVMNGTAMFSPSNALRAYSSPVFYADEAAFTDEFMRTAKGIEDEAEFIRSLGREVVKNIVFRMFRFAILCTKHPGFREELEWRVIASPMLEPSPRLKSDIETVRGVPQTVLKIKLENVPQEGLVGMALPELVDRIIIGPCEFPLVTRRGLVQLLNSLNVPDADRRVVVSDIPLRHHA